MTTTVTKIEHYRKCMDSGPSSYFDPGGLVCSPKEWESVEGTVIRFDGKKSPDKHLP